MENTRMVFALVLIAMASAGCADADSSGDEAAEVQLPLAGGAGPESEGDIVIGPAPEPFFDVGGQRGRALARVPPLFGTACFMEPWAMVSRRSCWAART